MFCKYCGKELNDDAIFCPYCGKDQTGEASGKEAGDTFVPEEDGDFTSDSVSESNGSDSSGHLSKKAIIAIVVVIAAAVVVAGLGVYFHNNHSSGARLVQTAAAPKLSAENVSEAQSAIDAVDKYLSSETLEDFLYMSGSAAEDLRTIENSFVEEEDAATEEIVEQIVSYIDKIIVELDLNEKTVQNAVRVFGEGGETADRDLIQEYRDEIEKLINRYS